MIHEARNPLFIQTRRISMEAAIKEKRIIVLIVEPNSNCNLKCTYCDLHSGRLENADQFKGQMTTETFQRLIDELAMQPFKLKEMQYHGNGEPLLNKKLPEFIAYAKKRNVAEVHRITTNGTLLTPKYFSLLIENGIDEIHISLDVADRARYKELKGKDLYPKVEKNIEHILKIIENDNPPIKLVIKCAIANNEEQYGFTKNEMDGVIKKYGNIAEKNKNFIIRMMPVLPMMGGLVEKKVAYSSGCESPFYSLFVKYNGLVSTCCADSTNLLSIGNIQEQSLQVIMNSEKLKAIRKCHLLRDFKDIQICLYCGARTLVDSAESVDALMEHI